MVPERGAVPTPLTGRAIPRAGHATLPVADTRTAFVPVEQAAAADILAHSQPESRRPIFDPSKPDIPAAHRRIDRAVRPVSANMGPTGVTTTTVHKIPVAQSRSSLLPAASTQAAPPALRPRLTNSRTFRVNYQIADQGPAGVQKVELHYTDDKGKTWQLLGEDPDRVPPFDVTVPEEGSYGLYVGVTNPAGYADKPKAGTAPQLEVVVDITAPTAELYEPVPDPRSKDTLLISWAARDPHLSEAPVSLYFAEKPDGDLFEIATGLRAVDQYSWQVPQGCPYRVYLLLVAEDLAGNTSQAITPNPILVDFSRPKAVGVDILVALPEENRQTR